MQRTGNFIEFFKRRENVGGKGISGNTRCYMIRCLDTLLNIAPLMTMQIGFYWSWMWRSVQQRCLVASSLSWSTREVTSWTPPTHPSAPETNKMQTINTVTSQQDVLIHTLYTLPIDSSRLCMCISRPYLCLLLQVYRSTSGNIVAIIKIESNRSFTFYRIIV